MLRILTATSTTALLLLSACGDATGPGTRLPALETLPWETMDGAHIAFVRHSSDARVSGVFVLNGETRSGIVAPTVPNATLSPDGSQVAFVQLRASPTGFEVQLMEVETWGPSMRRLSAAEGLGSPPAWSTTGSHVYFHAHHLQDPHGTSIYRVPAVGGQEQLVWHGLDVNHAPRGRISLNSQGSLTFVGLLNQLLLLPPGATEPAVVYTAPAGGRLFSPHWSPDGTTIAFLELVDGQDGVTKRIRSIAPDGTGLRTITELHGGDQTDLSANPLTHGLCWLSASRLAFTHRSGAGPAQAIYTVPSAGGAPVQLTSPPAGQSDSQLTCAARSNGS